MNRYRGMSDGEREIWNEMQADAAPDIRVLWDKTPVARKPHRCDCCGGEIASGEKYESRGIVLDGAFQAEKLHRWAYQYPSGCPRLRARDMAEIQEEPRP